MMMGAMDSGANSSLKEPPITRTTPTYKRQIVLPPIFYHNRVLKKVQSHPFIVKLTHTGYENTYITRLCKCPAL